MRTALGRALAAPALQRGLLILVIAVATAQPASARILRTRRSPSATWSPLAPLIIGGGAEYQPDSEQSQYDFPLLLEYGFTERFKMTVEPDFVYIDSKSKDVRSVGGLGDLETGVEYEFLSERRYRPALTAEGFIRWPTAADPDLGDPGTDYSLGLILSKDLVFMDLDLDVLYTFIGDPEQKDTLELSLAGEYHLNRHIDLEAEVLTAIGTGGIRGRPGTIAGFGGPGEGGNTTEGTLGFAWHVNNYLKLEQGVVLASDQPWQIVFAWEYSFGGED